MTDLLVPDTAADEPERSGSDAEIDSLLLAAARGDREAFAAVYDATAGAAFGLALRVIGSRGAAEGVVSAAFLEVWRTARSFAASGMPARTWVLAAVGRLALASVRDAAGVVETGPVDVRIPVDPLQARMAELTPAQRQVIALASFAGCSQAEIAERTGHPVGAVKTRMREALTRLQDASPRTR
ncbi:sigma factor-like helix-turn-helix DNA-binding protein [Microbacterium sp. cf332]|uniref:sigma factor-like helix-turn-helix DNA-binding protein n=1 Tax=Microbacterium sp. cf332 TaxID=1761804 RepID=UPI0008811256|nr:sigma factor-like helix-turn-helix DNA-binding protein [Microbacterium sp. cf332]SDQ97036.1 RNA polymerase sigma-70 factor, ECF subfamily [Microbacterium sp. cf332]